MNSQMLSRMMGGHPLVIMVKSILLVWIISGALFGISIFVWIHTSGGVALAAAVVGLFSIFVSLVTIQQSLIALFLGLANWYIFHKAMVQIRAGHITPSYAVLGTSGICVVDEANCRLFANGCVSTFAEIDYFSSHCAHDDIAMTRHHVFIYLKAGPKLKICFHNEVLARNLHNRLVFSIRGFK